jgi:SAM-dependent methyltransferase
VSARADKRDRSEAAIWQAVEFGSYGADLPLWAELAMEIDGPILELGAGAGRVALHLAERGHSVIALDADEDLLAELTASAGERGLTVETIAADLLAPRELELAERPGGVFGPLHVIQMLEVDARPALLGRLRDLAAPGATIALTVVDEATLLGAGTGSPQILPDMREFDGWVYSSEPLWVQVSDDTLRVRRIRECVSPEGQMDRSVHDDVLHRLSPEALEAEVEQAGLRPSGRRQIVYGPDDADSVVVLLEVPK